VTPIMPDCNEHSNTVEDNDRLMFININLYSSCKTVIQLVVFCFIWCFSESDAEAEVDMMDSESEGGDDVDKTLPYGGG
jgi:hypothetical protein